MGGQKRITECPFNLIGLLLSGLALTLSALQNATVTEKSNIFQKFKIVNFHDHIQN